MTTSVDTKRAAERRDRAFLAATLVAWARSCWPIGCGQTSVSTR